MTRYHNPTVPPAKPMATTQLPWKAAQAWYWVVSRLFGRKPVKEGVVTRIHLDGNPETVWNHLLFYEEVPGRPPFFLRALLPQPVRTEGVKNRVGAMVRCVYKGGDLVKRITTVDPPHFLEFEVVEQRLGIEDCILTLGGSYEICTFGDATEVIVMTNYEAYLSPRYLWRPLESFLIRQLHRHILRGVSAIALPTDPLMHPLVAESFPSQFVPPGDLACTASPSRSRR